MGKKSAIGEVVEPGDYPALREGQKAGLSAKRMGALSESKRGQKKLDDFGPVHGGDAPPFMGGPMGGQYHLRMRL